MAYTDSELTILAEYLARQIFVKTNAVANSDVTALKLAINKIDQIFALTTTQANNLRPAEVIRDAIINEVKAVAPNMSNQDIAVAMIVWTAKEAGLLSLLN